MTDAVILIALAQVISFGGLLYLYVQVQQVSQAGGPPARERAPQQRRQAPAPQQRAPQQDTDAILARLSELDVDVPAMARRMHKSEEEIRLLLRRRSAGRS